MGTTPKLAHVVLQTAQPEAMRDWYCAVLAGHVVYAGHGLTFLTFDEEHHRIALLTLPAEAAQPKGPGAVGMHHTAFTFDSLDGLLERYEDLRAAGIEPAVPIQHGVTTSLYYRDPDGNFVEMQVDNFATAEDATAYMEGPEYDADPIGPAFDVQRMVADKAAGVSHTDLCGREWALAGPALPSPMAILAGAEPAAGTP